jgi:hypothetical protein
MTDRISFQSVCGLDNGPSILDRVNVAFVNLIYDLPIFRNGESLAGSLQNGAFQESGVVKSNLRHSHLAEQIEVG